MNSIFSTDEKNSIRLEKIVAAIPCGVGIFTVDSAIHPVYMSEKGVELLNLSHFRYSELVHEDSVVDMRFFPENIYDIAKDYADSGKPYTYVLPEVTTPEGKTRYLQAEISFETDRETSEKYLCYAVISDITSQVVASIQTQNTLEKLRIALDNTEILIWELDLLNNKVIFDERSPFAVPENFSPFDLKNYFANAGFVHPDDLPKLLDMLEDMYHGIDRKGEEVRFLMAPGSSEYFWLRISHKVKRDINGKAVSVICSSASINKEKQIERQFQEETKFRELLLKDSIFSIKVNVSTNKISSVESAFANLDPYTAYENADAYMHYLISHIDSDKDRETGYKECTSANLKAFYDAGRRSLSNNMRIATTTLGHIWVRMDVDLLLNPITNEVEVFGRLENIDIEVFGKSILDSISSEKYDFISIIDIFSKSYKVINYGKHFDRDRLPECGDAHLMLVDYAKKYVSDADLDQKLNALNVLSLYEMCDNGFSFSLQFNEYDTGSGPRNKILTVTPLQKENRLMYFTVEDITEVFKERQNFEMQLADSLKAAEQVNKTKQEFLLRMGHELRTPLNIICGSADRISGSKLIKKTYQEQLEKIKDSSQYLASVVADALEFTDLDSKVTLKQDNTSLRDVISKAVLLLKNDIVEKNITLIEDVADSANIPIICDANRVQQVLVHLLTTSVRFTGRNHTIRLTASLSSIDESKARMDIAIHDDGDGFSPDSLNKLFDPFFYVDEAGTTNKTGSGLGLSITKKLIESMNGHISVASDFGVGTTFKVSIPAEFLEADTSMIGLQLHNVQFEGMRALVVDDNEANRDIINAVMSSFGFAVDCVENGLKAVDTIFYSPEGYYNVIIMDIMMPIMNGYDSVSYIRELDRSDSKDIVIIALSANALTSDVEKSLAVGMNGHLGKPLKPKELFDILKLTLKQ